MTWFAVLALAALCFAGALLMMRGGRHMWTSLLASLALGLSGYAWQASPDAPAAPKMSAQSGDEVNWGLVDDRKEMVGEGNVSVSDKVLMADAFARRGDHEEAVALLRYAVEDNDQDFDAWLAMGISLAEHSDGVLTPPASFAFDRAAQIAPENPAPGYFVGLALIRRGAFPQAAQIWRQTLEGADPKEEGYPLLAERMERLDALITQIEGNMAQEGSAAPPLEANQAAQGAQ